jgi:tRNA pseudouridine32 synthase / 23S rRNA pseudouridine746 synthase
LDAEVSGVILFATSAEFHRAANLAFEHKKIKKTYQAFTSVGPFTKGQSVLWKSKLLRGKKRTFEAPYGKDSLTEGVVIHKTSSHLEWHLNPVTGRAHQLRFELFKNNCPILGDKLYGSQLAWNQPGIALRAIQIDFPQDFISSWDLPACLEAKPLLPP